MTARLRDVPAGSRFSTLSGATGSVIHRKGARGVEVFLIRPGRVEHRELSGSVVVTYSPARGVRPERQHAGRTVRELAS